MHSSASRAMDGTSSANCACEASNRRLISEARKEPKASAANSGTVIIGRLRLETPIGSARLLAGAAKAATPAFTAVQPYLLDATDACDVGHRLEENLGILWP